ncbi:thymus-specific serine protease-like [Neocloeon triangulifer]|uniref:thymus-specific serine protease-like n=1 Tax=Neocloeon triangulifer TaxID=2078957 RepID=UPI00286F4FF8|nr:thymus-specific serine protease-like [Neocloeon triangulifer]
MPALWKLFLPLLCVSLAKASDVFDFLRPTIFPKVSNDKSLVEEWYFTQKVDHFNILDDRTWSQRFFLSNTTYNASTPVLLVLGGEWQIEPGHVNNGFIAELAERFGAFVIYLEHRFYGQSKPVPDLSLENLAFLTMDQAMEDTAFFAQSTKIQMGLDGPWILIGASYTGDMAAWARARYPHVFHAAYASGAPVLAKAGYEEYFEVVNTALLIENASCPSVIEAAMNELQILIENGLADNITTLFNLAERIDLANLNDLTFFRFQISAIFATLVQIARPGSNGIICDTLLSGQDNPLDTYSGLLRLLMQGNPLNVNTTKIVEKYRDQVEFSETSYTRQWIYHCCNEFGWFNPLSSPNQPFGQQVPLDFMLKFCSSVYGPEFTPERLEAGTARTNLLYGGKNPQASRIIYTVGTLDPVNPVQMDQDINPESPVIFIEGMSHCVDVTDASKPNDPQSLIDARQRIFNIFESWL